MSAIFYILVTISQLFRSNGNGIHFFDDPIFGSANTALTYIIRVLILISIIGVVNSFAAISLRGFQSLIDKNLFLLQIELKNIS